ncbi:MAG: acyl carrier protein [Firmicutes bacterium]|nr:acyl carrier protein [Bacillota bacterium]MDD4263588.1 acyl carrier protein [Bacillota bacterium]MDD4693528.1 acyl carrier protein [Bacillota bacterium]
MDILAQVIELVADKLNVDADEITEETTFEDLGADSLDIVELVMALEEEFDLEISDDDADKISSIGDAVAYIKEHKE